MLVGLGPLDSPEELGQLLADLTLIVMSGQSPILLGAVAVVAVDAAAATGAPAGAAAGGDVIVASGLVVVEAPAAGSVG